VLLIADGPGRSTRSAGQPIRRFRLARLQFEGRDPAPDARYDHLKRVFD
jgi:hypothetical protein